MLSVKRDILIFRNTPGRGAFPVSLAVSALFSLHALLVWPGNYMEQANRMGELASFWVIVLVPGYLFDRQRSLLEDLARANREDLLALVSALYLRERNTLIQSQRARDCALLIAERLEVDDRGILALGSAPCCITRERQPCRTISF